MREYVSCLEFEIYLRIITGLWRRHGALDHARVPPGGEGARVGVALHGEVVRGRPVHVAVGVLAGEGHAAAAHHQRALVRPVGVPVLGGGDGAAHLAGAEVVGEGAGGGRALHGHRPVVRRALHVGLGVGARVGDVDAGVHQGRGLERGGVVGEAAGGAGRQRALLDAVRPEKTKWNCLEKTENKSRKSATQLPWVRLREVSVRARDQELAVAVGVGVEVVVVGGVAGEDQVFAVRQSGVAGLRTAALFD